MIIREAESASHVACRSCPNSLLFLFPIQQRSIILSRQLSACAAVHAPLVVAFDSLERRTQKLCRLLVYFSPSKTTNFFLNLLAPQSRYLKFQGGHFTECKQISLSRILLNSTPSKRSWGIFFKELITCVNCWDKWQEENVDRFKLNLCFLLIDFILYLSLKLLRLSRENSSSVGTLFSSHFSSISLDYSMINELDDKIK